MKILREEEVCICDFCNEDGHEWQPCLGCGKHFCYDCGESKAVTYSHAVHFGGTGDGRYCLDCNTSCANTELHSAYNAIRSLKHEAEGWSSDFRKRSDLAEARLKQLTEEGKSDV